MIDPLSSLHAAPHLLPSTPATPALRTGHSTGEFASALRNQLEQVGQAQAEADRGIEKVLTGQSDNISEVFVAARKAEVAFSLLMEIRNKLVDAYNEIKQLRV